MQLFLLFINKEQIQTVYSVLKLYPINDISIFDFKENCIDIYSNLPENTLNEILKEFFYKIGYYNTFLLMDPNLDYEVLL